jgi:hypothetical protein
LLVYRKAETATIEGGSLHFLFQWGLTTAQEQQATRILQETDPKSKLVGAAEIRIEPDERLTIVPGNEVSNILIQSLTSPVKLPVMAAHKTAAAFRFSAKDAAVIWNAVRKQQQLNGVKFRCRFFYTVASYEGGVRTAKEVEGQMEASFRQWTWDLLQYNLVKMQKI